MKTLDNKIVIPATVRHVSRDVITIQCAHGYTATVFNVADEHVEAIVAADDGSETIRLLVEAPGPGRTMAIERDTGSSVVTIRYKAKG